MKINVLHYSPEMDDCGPVCGSMEIGKADDLKPFLHLKAPAVYLIKKENAARLKKHIACIVDRGRKHKAKPLAELLLKKDGIPLIDANYTKPDQVKRSIKAFLKKAVHAKENKLFILSSDETVFNALWEKRAVLSDKGHALTEISPGDQGDPAHDERQEYSAYFGNSDKINKVRQLIVRAARVDYPVLILGPSGTGKELVAAAIHNNSKRCAQNFITVNCGAIPDNLLEAELFGYRKGAFTGAVNDKTGKWKLAHGGSLFLDEIGDLKLDHQVKILRAIETNIFYPIGAEAPVKANVRIIAATHRDIFTMMQREQFRDDLYYRLAGIVIPTPALRDHPEDLPALIDKLWSDILEENLVNKDDKTAVLNKKLPGDVIKKMMALPWPGNVRQLKNILRRLYALFWDFKQIEANDLVEVINLEKAGTARGTELVAALDHNKRVEAIINATRSSLEMRVEKYKDESSDGSFVETALQFHLDEIESLCRSPLLFAEAVFLKVNDLKGKLVYFSHLFKKNPAGACAYWKTEAAHTFDDALAAIQEARMVLKDRS